ncbi:hypothetical protein [Clostridium botulinum]|uniref:hypothetical protein n=1 Tax=Clostridium botulinum TaxID=1491 RepID=UPI002989A636
MARCTYDRAVYIASVYKKAIENAEYEINKDYNVFKRLQLYFKGRNFILKLHK